MEPLEQVTLFMTLMHRLTQVMDRERQLLRGMELDALRDAGEEKATLAEAYEIELKRLRASPEVLAELAPQVRAELTAATRGFQEALTANVKALLGARQVVEKLAQHIADSLARAAAPHAGYGERGGPQPAEPRGQVIPLALNRRL